VATTAVFSEVLVIALSSVPSHPPQIQAEMALCSYLSMAILAVMVVTMALVLVWRWRIPYLPRRPSSIGNVVSYICSSRFMEEEVRKPKREPRDVGDSVRKAEAEDDSKLFMYAKCKGTDGIQRWAIDWAA